MDKFIEKVMYEVSGMRDMENYYPFVLKRTIELARIYPDLHFDFIDGGSESYVVFASQPFTAVEAYEYVKKKEETLVYLRKTLSSMDKEKRQNWLESFQTMKNISTQEEGYLRIILGEAKLYLHSNYINVEWETEEECFYNHYYNNEIEDILVSFSPQP